MNSQGFPIEFQNRLGQIFHPDAVTEVFAFMNQQGVTSFRVNTLKTNVAEMKQHFQQAGDNFRQCSWYENVVVVEPAYKQTLEAFIAQGMIYQQSLSSLLPVIVLDPQPQELILDLCAAPGSKTTQIAAQMNNTGKIIALELVRDRFYKLKSVLELLGVANTQIKWMDARRYHPKDVLFDRILVDAPCSSEGRFKTFEPKSFAYWSERKIKEMAHKQKGLLLNACRLLKPGGVLVYSTCTFAPEENEAVIDWLLKKMPRMTLEPTTIDSIKHYPAVMEWEGKTYNPAVKNCFRVLPDDVMEGFFIVKLIKQN